MSRDFAPQHSGGVLGGIGRACFRHRWLTLLSWLLGVACLITLWTRFGAAPDNSFGATDRGQTLLNQHFHRQSGDTLTLAIRSSGEIRSAAVRTQVSGALAELRQAPRVTSVTGPYQVPSQVSADGHIAFATVQFGVPSAAIGNSEALALMRDARAASGHGTTFSLGGDVVDLAETPYGGPSEGFGIVAAAIVLLIAFGSLLAMGLPLLTAVFGIGSGLSLIALLGHFVPAPSFSSIVASMIGLGVGVDYALFIVTRFREALRGDSGGRPSGQALRGDPGGRPSGQALRGDPGGRPSGQALRGDPGGRPSGQALRGDPGLSPEDAVVTAMRTAGRSVLTAGTTVVIGMLGLLVLRQTLLNGVAVAAAVTVAMTVLGALTLLPALLGFTGTRLAKPSRVRLPLARRDRPAKASYTSKPAAERWAAMIGRRPVIAAVVSTAAILALAAPAVGMKLSMPDESAQARGTMGHASYATMARGFGPGFDAPLIIAAKLPAGGASAATARLASAVRGTPGVATVTPVVVSRDGQAAMLVAYPATGEQDPATDAVVNKISGTVLPQATRGTGIRAYVTGPNAGNVTFANVIGKRLPWLIAVVVVVSMLLLLVVFRSVLVAVKATVMNLLSISAAYGVLVMVTQHGWLGHLFGFGEKMPVTTWVPVFLFVILFGLSMDYEVFLLSRIREAYDASGDNSASVARELASTARVISAAAAIMVAVFLSFVLGADVSVKQVGLGLAVAVLIDATIVRLVLVPAVMELLGKANWWLPAPLARILPTTSRREDEPPAVARVPVSAVD
jgi:RND superfamily putative drug exporter